METLVLSQSYQPIKIIPWFDAFVLLMKRSAHLIEHYGERPVRAGPDPDPSSLDFDLRSLQYYDEEGKTVYVRPSIIKFNKSFRNRRVIRFSRDNIYIRDGGKCQYCGKHVPRDSFTYDHVQSRAKGGKTVWTNVVCSCLSCNMQKGNRTPSEAGMHLLSTPVVPKSLPAFQNMRLMWRKGMPESWRQHLEAEMSDAYWNVELEHDE